MPYSREGAGSPFPQGEDEEISYEFDFTPWVDSSAPTTPVVTLWNIISPNKETDLSSSNLSGSASVSGNIVSTPLVYDLKRGAEYRLNVLVTLDGNKKSAFVKILGEP